MPVMSTWPGSRRMSPSTERTWRAPKAATRRATAIATSPNPMASRMKAGTSSTPSAARSPSRVVTDPWTVAPAAWVTVPFERPDVALHGRPGREVGMAVDDDERARRGARERRGASNEDDRPDVAADPGVAVDHDQRVEVIARRDGHRTGDGDEDALGVRSGLGREGDRRADAEEEDCRCQDGDEAFHGVPFLEYVSSPPTLRSRPLPSKPGSRRLRGGVIPTIGRHGAPGHSRARRRCIIGG